MGRKKSRRTQVRAGKAPRQEKRYNCMLCSQEQVVRCTIDYEKGRGYATCGICSATFQCDANRLSQPIDVYSSWVDDHGEGDT